MTDKPCVAYGYWKSAIRPADMAGQIPLSDALWDTDGARMVWLERRSDRGVLVCRNGEDAPYDITEGFSVRGRVGYGGGDFTVSHGFVVFAEKSGRLYRQSLEPGTPFPITPEFGAAAAPTVSPDGRWVLFIHSYERRDVIGVIDSRGERWPLDLISGADFYMQPVWHPSGDRIAWIEWDHPHMPWDETRLMIGELNRETPRITGKTQIAAGADIPAFQPAFSPDGQWLAYIITRGEWDSLVVRDLNDGSEKTLVDNVVLAEPAWIQGIRVYGWMADSQRIVYRRNDRGFASLWVIDVETGETRQMDLPDYTWFSQITPSPTENAIAFIASAPQIPDRIVSWRPEASVIHRRSRSEMIHPDDLPCPRPISWAAPDETPVHALYFPPSSRRFSGSGLPPAIINLHGGPTGQRAAAYASDAAFFTNRGYAFIEVNYRGSAGYGRAYMTALREKWGLLDVEDAVGAGQALVEQRLADPARLIIKGGSAGGYTVLNALIRHPGVFRAGICLYGVTNLFALASDTHKFEERYLDSMVGPLPETRDRYQNWSPLFHADAIRDPVAFFQGSEDTVVLPDQTESIVRVLQRNGVPHIYRLYEGEGHGWRKTETITSYYADVERFLKQYVL